MCKKIMKISSSIQLEIFEAVLLHLLEYPSMRWKIKAMIEFRDRVDEAQLDLELRKLELEIIKKGEHNENQFGS